MRVPFVSFLPMEKELDADLRAAFSRVLERSWYIDGKEMVSYRMLESKTNRWHVTVYQQNESNLGSDISVDWIKYTPYFDDSLRLVSPVNGTEVSEEQNVVLKAETTLDTDKIDYYVNDVYAGSGTLYYRRSGQGLGMSRIRARRWRGESDLPYFPF